MWEKKARKMEGVNRKRSVRASETATSRVG